MCKNKSKLNYLPPAAFRQFPLTKMFYFCARIIDVVVVVIAAGAVVVLLLNLKQLLRVANF